MIVCLHRDENDHPHDRVLSSLPWKRSNIEKGKERERERGRERERETR